MHHQLALPDCPVIADPFRDASGLPPAHEATPCFKGLSPLGDYLLLNYGRGFLIVDPRPARPRVVGGANLYCHLSRPCPGSIPGDYDCPLRRIATCEGCEYVISTGGAGTGGTVITQLHSSGGAPWAGTSWLVPHSAEGGAATYIEGVQYVVTSRWPGCPGPALWRIDGTTPPPAGATLAIGGYRSDEVLYLTRLQCLTLPPARRAPIPALLAAIGASDVVMGGIRMGDYLYTAGGSAAVTIWEITAFGLIPVAPAPFAGYYYDGICLAYDERSQLLATGHPRPQLWDVSAPASPQLVTGLEGRRRGGADPSRGPAALVVECSRQQRCDALGCHPPDCARRDWRRRLVTSLSLPAVVRGHRVW